MNGASVVAAEVRDARALKRHVPLSVEAGVGGVGVSLDAAATSARAADFERRIVGASFAAPARRGKFLWVPIAGGSPVALLAHLGMSGQMLLRAHDAPDDAHVRVRLWIEHPEHGELRLDFSDQRLFGSLAIDGLVATDDGFAAGRGAAEPLIPGQAAHIARDPLDPAFDDALFIARLRARPVAVKRQLLDQALISGVGNIYADEALWRARIHPETAGTRIGAAKAAELLAHVREVFAKALAEGGTSFDAQYVNVNGQAGYFAHSLNAYGRTGEACPRCGGPITRMAFMNRGSHFCPRCQRKRV
ncbi:DNA-formamidopyrimidine glycosylase [Leucobacter sp. OLES1]|nr:DNA-formamidopyrimidine glycosylase [Leucobacter sp. OLES1]